MKLSRSCEQPIETSLPLPFGGAYKVRHIDFGGEKHDFDVMANRATISILNLHFMRTKTPISVSYSDMEGFRQPIIFSGESNIDVDGRRSSSSVDRSTSVPPQVNYDIKYSSEYEQLLIDFNNEGLCRHLEMLTGVQIRADIDLQLSPTLEGRNYLRLRAIALALSGQLIDQAALQRSSVVELEQILLNAFLEENFAMPIQKRVLRPSDKTVSRMEEYIHANWRKPLTVEDISRETGISVRSVYLLFQERKNCSPMTYIRDVRLEHARKQLLKIDQKPSVLSVALACGFSSFGHFASRYQTRFGELPSETVLRGIRNPTLRR